MNRTLYQFPRNSDSTYWLVETDEMPFSMDGRKVICLQRANPLGRRTFESVITPEAATDLVAQLRRWRPL